MTDLGPTGPTSPHVHHWQPIQTDFVQDMSLSVLLVCVGCNSWTWQRFRTYVETDPEA